MITVSSNKVSEHGFTGAKPANKNAVGTRRAACRVIASAEQQDRTESDERQAAHTREYVAKAE